MTTAMVPGTFDPLTLGHEALIRRAKEVFGQVVVAVSTQDRSPCCLPFKERMACVANVFADMSSIRVVPLDGLLVDCAREHGARLIVRSIRHGSDLDEEVQMAQSNARLDPNLETFFLAPRPAHTGIKGSLVRQIWRLGGDVAPFVSPAVATVLEANRVDSA